MSSAPPVSGIPLSPCDHVGRPDDASSSKVVVKATKTARDAVSQLLDDQTLYLPGALAELNREGKKTSHWIWWAFPTTKPGNSQPGAATFVTTETAKHLIDNAPGIWRQVLEKIVDLLDHGTRNITDVLPDQRDVGRVRAFVDFWEGQNPATP